METEEYERYFMDVGWGFPLEHDSEIKAPQEDFGKIESKEYITYYGYYEDFLYLFRKKKTTVNIACANDCECCNCVDDGDEK